MPTRRAFATVPIPMRAPRATAAPSTTTPTAMFATPNESGVCLARPWWSTSQGPSRVVTPAARRSRPRTGRSPKTRLTRRATKPPRICGGARRPSSRGVPRTRQPSYGRASSVRSELRSNLRACPSSSRLPRSPRGARPRRPERVRSGDVPGAERADRLRQLAHREHGHLHDDLGGQAGAPPDALEPDGSLPGVVAGRPPDRVRPREHQRRDLRDDLERTESTAPDEAGLYETDATWSADGKHIAFAAQVGGGRAKIYVVDVATRKVRKLTKSRGDDFACSWSPDGKKIVFASNRDHPSGDANQVYVMSPDGSHCRAHARRRDRLRRHVVVAGRKEDRGDHLQSGWRLRAGDHERGRQRSRNDQGECLRRLLVSRTVASSRSALLLEPRSRTTRSTS